MSIFKNLLAATAIVNFAFAGTAYSSDVASVVTSIQLVTSVTYIDPPAASSSTHCNTLTVTEIAPPPGASGTEVLESSETVRMTIQTSIPSAISKVQPTETCVNSIHTVSHGGRASTITACHMNGTKTATATGTGGASASASYTASALPPFTDAADAANVGAAVLFGGILMALFGA